MRVLAFILAIMASSKGYAFLDEERYCTAPQLQNGTCKAGDLILLPAPLSAVKFCDFEKQVVVIPTGNASAMNGQIICYFSGKERTQRVKLTPVDEDPFMKGNPSSK